MQYRFLGRTGLKVSILSLGCINFGRMTDESTAHNIIHAALDSGVNFIDTADVYGLGVSEECIGKAIKNCRDKVLVSTKFGKRIFDGPNMTGNSRRYVIQSVERSLTKLQTDYIDFYHIHQVDPNTPIEETLIGLNLLLEQGKVRYIGCSDMKLWELVESLWMSSNRQLVAPSCTQWPLHLLDRRYEEDINVAWERFGLGVLTYHPLAGGWLTGKYSECVPDNSRGRILGWQFTSPMALKRREYIEHLRRISEEYGLTIVQLALGWLTSRHGVSSIIMGPRTEEQLETYLTGISVELSTEALRVIDKLSPLGCQL